MDSAELLDMIAGDAKSSEISDALKDMLYAKSADTVDKMTPHIAAGLFGDNPEEQEVEQPEANAEVETQDQEQQEEE
tara:strand:- start:461 stop:691 length:231 start_codon:yes stop_codon:yes gene_type:complete